MPHRNKNNIKIGLLWHSLDTGNLGIGALTIGNLFLIENSLAKNGLKGKFIIFGPARTNFSEIAEFSDIEYFELSTCSVFIKLPTIIKKMRSCDFIFDIGSGDSFSDIYGFKRFAKITFSKFLVSSRKTRLILSPQTIGPFNNFFSEYLAKLALHSAEKIFARDQLSLEYANSMGVSQNNVVLSFDVAIALPHQITKKNNKKIKIGLNVSALLYNGGYKKNNFLGICYKYKEITNRIIIEYSKNKEIEIHLIPHVISNDENSIENDYAICKYLVKKHDNLVLSPFFMSPSDAKTYISNMDFFIGARMHSTIAAFSTNVPFVALAYSRKFSGLFGTVNYPAVLNLS
jgi:polysaccharide pyruvyl transferase WcaK-like protein